MAYSNWGAFVYVRDQRRTDREDVAVFGDDGGDLPSATRIYFNIIKNREKYPEGGEPWHEHVHHAVLGDGPVRLTGYKHSPELWHLQDDGEVVQVDLAPFKVDGGSEDWDDATYEGDYEGVGFRAEQYDGNMVKLALTEADGTQWTSTCGYEFGAGWDD